MPIKVSCHCGQNFTAKDELRGQTLLCPKCHQPLTIGEEAKAKAATGGGMDELFDDVGLKEVKGQRCPNCGEGMPANGVLCVHCGFNVQTGEVMSAAELRVAKGERVTESILKNAAQQLELDKQEEKKNRSQGAPAWLLFVGLALVVGFTVTMYLLPREQAFLYTGNAIIIIAAIVQAIIGIRLIVIAFLESIVQGLLMFVPPYILYYIATRWSKCGGPVLMAIGMLVLQGVGYGFIALAPLMRPSEEQAALRAPPAAVVVTELQHVEVSL